MTYYRDIQTVIEDSINECSEEIKQIRQYIQHMKTTLNYLSAPERAKCPLCPGEMIDLSPIDQWNLVVRRQSGAWGLHEFMSNGHCRQIATSWECQECGLFQTSFDGKIKYNWTKETRMNKRSLASIVLKTFPCVQQVVMTHLSTQAIFLFWINETWWTFGELSKTEIADRLGIADELKTLGAPKNTKGYVYLIKSETGHYKIGRSKNVPERMNLFAVKLPFDFEIVHQFPCDNMYKTERDLHKVFSEKRVNGEWFALDQDDVTHIKSIAA